MCETPDEIMEMIIREQTLESKEEIDFKIAKNMLNLGYSTKLIAEITYMDIQTIKQLPVGKIKRIRKKLSRLLTKLKHTI